MDFIKFLKKIKELTGYQIKNSFLNIIFTFSN